MRARLLRDRITSVREKKKREKKEKEKKMWEKLERSQWMFGEILKFVLNSVYIGASPLPASNFVSFSSLAIVAYFYSFEIACLFIYLFIYLHTFNRSIIIRNFHSIRNASLDLFYTSN